MIGHPRTPHDPSNCAECQRQAQQEEAKRRYPELADVDAVYVKHRKPCGCEANEACPECSPPALDAEWRELPAEQLTPAQHIAITRNLIDNFEATAPQHGPAARQLAAALRQMVAGWEQMEARAAQLEADRDEVRGFLAL